MNQFSFEILKLIFLDFPEFVVYTCFVYIVANERISKNHKNILLTSLIGTIVFFILSRFDYGVDNILFFLMLFNRVIMIKLLNNKLKLNTIVSSIFSAQVVMLLLEFAFVIIPINFLNITIDYMMSNIFLWIAISIPTRVVEFYLLYIGDKIRKDITSLIKNLKESKRREKDEAR